MKNYNEEYFYLERSGDRYPLLDYADSYDGNSCEVFDEFALDTTEVRLVSFADPIPYKPLLGDHHFLTRNAPVISGRLKDVLEGLKLKDMQFLPATIEDDRGNEYEGFYIIHVYNMIRCMDKEKSEWRPCPWDMEDAIGIEKLVLDNEALERIPLQERLVFALDELGTYALYHQSVVEKILAIEPTGLTVYRLSKYDSGLPFREEYIANFTDSDEEDLEAWLNSED